MVFLARCEDEWPVSVKRVAEGTGIPQKYLSKILSDLARVRLLAGSRGRHGGFRMVRSPKSISVFEVLAPFESLPADRRACPFGNVECTDVRPCPAHDRWKLVVGAYERFLRETSVYDISVKRDGKDGAAKRGRKRKLR